MALTIKSRSTRNKTGKEVIMKVKKQFVLGIILAGCAGGIFASFSLDSEHATKQVVNLMTVDPNFSDSDVWRVVKERTLVGLTSVGLVVYRSDSNFGTEPLKKSRSVDTGPFRNMIKDKLNSASFKILSNDELISEPGSPLLVVDIHTHGPIHKDFYITEDEEIAPSPLGYKGECHMSLWQEGLLARDRNISQYGVTWSGKMVNLEWAKTRGDLENSIRSGVLEVLNDFIVAHLTANKKAADVAKK